MAFNPQFKINQMAKDMGLKSKELTDLLADKGVGEVKSQKTLTEQEFNILFQSLTEANQVDNIYDYMDGKTCIPSRIAAAKPRVMTTTTPFPKISNPREMVNSRPRPGNEMVVNFVVSMFIPPVGK